MEPEPGVEVVSPPALNTVLPLRKNWRLPVGAAPLLVVATVTVKLKGVSARTGDDDAPLIVVVVGAGVMVIGTVGDVLAL